MVKRSACPVKPFRTPILAAPGRRVKDYDAEEADGSEGADRLGWSKAGISQRSGQAHDRAKSPQVEHWMKLDRQSVAEPQLQRSAK